MSQESSKIVLICGLPGAGKTTLAMKMAEELPAIRFCPDEWMLDLSVSLWNEAFRDKLERRFLVVGKELLKLGQNVILEYGFWGKSEREEKLDEARTLGASVELYYLEVPLEELRKRLLERNMEGDSVIASKLEEYSDKFQRPDKSELMLYDNHFKH